MVLAPGSERILGVTFRTTADVRLACDHWRSGTAVGFQVIPVSWHWLVARHETNIPIRPQFRIDAPSTGDCGA